MDELVKDILPQLVSSFQLGPIAFAGTALMLLIRVYRLGPVQTLLPKQARWDSLPPAAKFLLPFFLALVGSFILSLAGGATVLASLAVALPAAVAAIAGHHATKSLGQAMTNSALKANGPSYTPSKFRKALSITVPLGKIPHDVFDRTP